MLSETGARAVAFRQLGWWYVRATEQALNTLPVDGWSTLCQLLTSDTFRRLRRTFPCSVMKYNYFFSFLYFVSFFVCRFGNEAVPRLVVFFVCVWVLVRNVKSHLLDFLIFFFDANHFLSTLVFRLRMNNDGCFCLIVTSIVCFYRHDLPGHAQFTSACLNLRCPATFEKAILLS
jgi:hypothetical protein